MRSVFLAPEGVPQAPERLIADKGYDCDDFWGWLRRKGVIPCIRPRKSRTERRKTWDDEYKERRHIERTFAWVGKPPATARALRGVDLRVRCFLHRGMHPYLLEVSRAMPLSQSHSLQG